MIELAVDDLHLTYGDNPVLKGVSMNLKRGEVVSLLGPSGSGKTTLLRAVAGLEKPTQGSIVIGNNKVYDGTPRSEVPAEERNLGWCSSPMPCGRTRPCLRTWPIRSSCAKSRPKRSSSACRTCWTSWVWAILANVTRTSSPVGSSSAWRLAVRWCTTRR